MKSSNIQKNQKLIIGLMSGTSLDGLDLAACVFEDSNPISYEIVRAETIPYDDFWIQRLLAAPDLLGKELVQLDIEYGKYLGETSRAFCERYGLSPDLISSHGHTIFHDPQQGYTFQLGDLNALSIAAGCDVVGDFRTADVLLGGQGAPLVPIGDELLFGDFDACLNLGGFANVSFEDLRQRIAFDICPLNMPLNELAAREGLEFDAGGSLADEGSVIEELLEILSQEEYYRLAAPKSLGREWYQERFAPILLNYNNHSTRDLLRTVIELQANCIGQAIPDSVSTVLVTGGGAYNTCLMNCLDRKRKELWQIPSKVLIDFKEALAFAFLGYRRQRNEINCLASVTGARKNHSSGILCYSS